MSIIKILGGTRKWHEFITLAQAGSITGRSIKRSSR